MPNKTYKIQYLAEVWLEADVEAASLEQAIDDAAMISNHDWRILHDTLEFQDAMWYLDETDDEWKEWK